MTGQRLIGLVGRIYNPPKAKKYSEVVPLIETWEMRVREYFKHTKQEPHPSAKIYCLKMMVPTELEKDSGRLGSRLEKYEETKSYVLEQVASRKEVWFTGEEQRPVPVDIGQMQGSPCGHGAGHGEGSK